MRILRTPEALGPRRSSLFERTAKDKKFQLRCDLLHYHEMTCTTHGKRGAIAVLPASTRLEIRIY